MRIRILKISVLVLVNLLIIGMLLYGFEYYLRATDPFLNLPFDSNYYGLYSEYYPFVEPPEGRYSWGHRVELNQYALREREFKVPKPPGVCRIMVLGDSFTWGKGLAVEERYTNLVEEYLRRAFRDKKFEVLNFSITGGPTLWQRDVLKESLMVDTPDLIVIGFTFNDTQPEAQDYRLEKEEFEAKYGDLLDSMSGGLIEVGLPLTAKLLRQAIDAGVVIVGLVPTWEEGLDRTYDINSKEWQDFKQALRDIKTMSDQAGLPAPIFAVLNQANFLDYPTDYRQEDQALPIYLQWYHQAQRAADEIGFRTYNHEAELVELQPEEIPVNELDQHPSTKVNLIYAEKLFLMLRDDIRRGQLCGQE